MVMPYYDSINLIERLHRQFEGITKILQQAGDKLPQHATIAHHYFEGAAYPVCRGSR